MHIAVLNKSTVVTTDEAQQMVDACAIQVRDHMCPAWGRVAIPVMLYTNETDAPPDSALVVILDNADHANALGYHSESPTGRKFGRVFAKLTLAGGGSNLHGPYSTSTVLSHEVLELAIDPTCSVWVDGAVSSEGHGSSYALEVGDPVQSNSYDVVLPDGRHVTVSDFVFPEWFDMGAIGKRCDQMDLVRNPFQLANGYCVVRTGPGSETPIWGMLPPDDYDDRHEHPASRTHRRLRML